ncbi:hypothetical protein BFW01_g11027 [Lasiodiplodia theobromae]|nr:hypothetical protein BFW01_g11027 [Lasiodiplodia theobromae]
MDFISLFHINPEIVQLLQDMSHDDLCAFAELHEDPQSDEQIELFIFVCFFIFLKARSTDYLDRAVQRAEGWMAVAPDNQPERTRRSQILDTMLAKKYQMQEVDIASNGQFHRVQSINDLNRAVQAADDAVEATPHNHPDRAACLSNLGGWLGRRFERTGEISDLNRAIKAADMAVEVTPLDHPERGISLRNLGILLGARSKRIGTIKDLDRAVEVSRMAVETTSNDHLDQAGHLSSLGARLGRRFEQMGAMGDLDQAIEFTNMAVEATPDDHIERAGHLNNLGYLFGRRFERMGAMEDLDQAVKFTNLAVEATPDDHPDRASHLNNFGNELKRRFERMDTMEDLDRAVEVANMAIEATPDDHPKLAIYLIGLGNSLGTRFKRMGAIDDLNRAIKVAEMAIGATPNNHPDRVSRLNNCGVWLASRFERIGAIKDLDRAVEFANMAVEATPDDHIERAGNLSNLGNWLGKRFDQMGAMGDLDRAIEFTNLAVEAAPNDHPDRAGHLNNLGNRLGSRFERTGEMADLNRAIKVIDEAVEATPIDNPDRVGRLNNLGIWLSRRFERTGEISDLNRAIEVTDKAVEATPLNNPSQATYQINLGNQLGTRFKQTDAIDGLNRAIKVAEMAIRAIPDDHPDRAACLNNLGVLFSTRFEQVGTMEDLDLSLASYKQGWNCGSAPPSIRITLARRAASILASQFQWEESSIFLKDAVMLLPAHIDKQHVLRNSAGLASEAAAIALNAGKEAHKALELLELGRGVIAGLLLDMRTDISDLKLQHPTLADEFASLRNELDSPAERTALSTPDRDTQSQESQARRRREANQRFEELIGEIRSQPGFQRFLLPPTADELMVAAQEGPIVVVNVSPYRCDAFLIERHQIRALPLPRLNLEELKKKLQELRTDRSLLTSSGQMEETLEWLWDVVTCPVLEALGFQSPIQDDKWPRIWWIPTGLLSHFPLHAAGYHKNRSPETVLDRVMSSYSPSIKALVYGRQNSIQKSEHTASKDALLVSMPDTPGQSSLYFAEQEVGKLKELCPSMQLNPVEPSKKNREDVLGCLRTSKIFHFAGHGHSHPTEPSQSSLLLSDWQTSPLTVADLRDQKLQESSPFLGYLSACSTGTNSAQQLTDEAIHLALELRFLF